MSLTLTDLTFAFGKYLYFQSTLVTKTLTDLTFGKYLYFQTLVNKKRNTFTWFLFCTLFICQQFVEIQSPKA